jgi:hypothetical protein
MIFGKISSPTAVLRGEAVQDSLQCHCPIPFCDSDYDALHDRVNSIEMAIQTTHSKDPFEE